MPTQYELAISVADDPINEAWIKAKSWVQETPHAQWSISRDEFDASLKTKDVKKQHPWYRLFDSKIGKLVEGAWNSLMRVASYRRICR